MAMDDEYQEVLFGKYCKSCKHKDKLEHEEPCAECLDNPVNLHSQKPIKYEEGRK